MYEVLCDSCGHYNYSASRIGKWICSYCGKELTIKLSTVEKGKNKELA